MTIVRESGPYDWLRRRRFASPGAQHAQDIADDGFRRHDLPKPPLKLVRRTQESKSAWALGGIGELFRYGPYLIHGEIESYPKFRAKLARQRFRPVCRIEADLVCEGHRFMDR